MSTASPLIVGLAALYLIYQGFSVGWLRVIAIGAAATVVAVFSVIAVWGVRIAEIVGNIATSLGNGL